MAKKAATTYMTTLERVLGGVLLTLYLLVLPFGAGPLFRGLGRLMGQVLSEPVQESILWSALLVVTLALFWTYIGRTTSHFLTATLQTLAAAGMGLVALYGINELAYRLFRLVAPDQMNLNDAAVCSLVGLAPRHVLAIVVFAAPVVEEALFRGYVFGNLRDRSRIAAYLISCLLYMLPHMWRFFMVDRSLESFLLMVQYMAPGAVLAWTYEKSGTLWGSIFTHWFVSFMAVI